MPDPITQALAPHINAKLSPAPRAHAIDIFEARIAHIDADIRAVTADGIRVFFDSEARVIPWVAIGEVRIVRKADGVVEASFWVGAEQLRDERWAA